MSVSVLAFQQPSVQWDYATTVGGGSLLVDLYVLLALVSVVVALVHILGNWILVPPLRRVPEDFGQRAAPVFRRQALSLRRWMFLNLLACAGVTLAQLRNELGGFAAQQTTALPVVAEVLRSLLQPGVLLWCTLMLLFVVRWHILWRAERLERRLQVPDDLPANISR